MTSLLQLFLLDMAIQTVAWAVAVVAKTEKFYDITGGERTRKL